MAEKCIYTNIEGEKCHSYSMSNSLYCLSHDPDKGEERLLRAQNGGKATSYEKLEMQLKPFDITGPDEIISAVLQTVNELRTGQVPPKIASTIGFLLNIALKGYEIRNIGDRVEIIDRVLLERKSSERIKP